MSKNIQTLKGPVEVDSLRLILPHEHLFTELRGPLVPDHAQAERKMWCAWWGNFWLKHVRRV